MILSECTTRHANTCIKCAFLFNIQWLWHTFIYAHTSRHSLHLSWSLQLNLNSWNGTKFLYFHYNALYTAPYLSFIAYDVLAWWLSLTQVWYAYIAMHRMHRKMHTWLSDCQQLDSHLRSWVNFQRLSLTIRQILYTLQTEALTSMMIQSNPTTEHF